MFDLSKLKSLYISRQQVFTRGREYYVSGAIKEVKLYQKFSGFEVDAVLQGTKLYKTMIKFDSNNKYSMCHCSCPSYANYNEPCKHVAALYHYLIESDKFNKSLNYIAAGDFLDNYFKDITDINKRRVNLEYTLETFGYASDIFANLSLKIGIDKMYVVKSIRQFIEIVMSEGILDFGKNFVFNGKIHDFKEEDREIVEFFIDIFSTEKTVKSESYYAQGNIFSGKNIKLDENLAIRFLKLLGNRKFTLVCGDETFEQVNADFVNYPFSIGIRSSEDSITAEIEYKEDCVFFRKYSNIIYSQGRLYVINKKNRLLKFVNAFKNNKTKQMDFVKENRDKLLSIIPSLASNEGVDISKEILDKYTRASLDARIYIDKYKKGISLRAEFSYGDEKFDPIFSQNNNPYIIREYEREESIIRIIEEAGFRVYDNATHLDDTDKVYIFFRDMLPVLSDYASLYYTDEVKQMYMGRVKSYRGYTRSRKDGVLDITFEIDNFNPKEIEEILRAIKEKKKYHKFKNGRIISLEGEDIAEISKLVEEVDEDELVDGGIELSRYRAFGLFGNEQFYNNIEVPLVLKDTIDKIKNYTENDLEVPELFRGVLRDYQITGYKWLKTLKSVGLGGILADDMGLGKTIQAITLMYDSINSNKTSMVVAPSSLIYNWESEINRFCPNMKVEVISGSRDERERQIEKIAEYDIVITSYPLMRRDIEFYKEHSFEYCIIDEAQHIKNPESINAKSVKSLNANYRFALTGTPMENSLIELWSIFDFLMPGYLLSRKGFSNRYEKIDSMVDNKLILSDLKKSISPFILRRKKKDVLKELPDKIETKLVCNLTDTQRDIYMAYMARVKKDIDKLIKEEGFEKSHIQILAAITRLRQICCHPGVFLEDYSGGSGKLELLEELLEELIDGEHRILIFSQFTSLLKLIEARLEEKDIDYLYLDGSTEVEKRLELVNSFNSGFGDVFLISLKAGGTGLNLTSADVVIHFDPWWNPAVEEQATDRAHRIGQENVVQVFKLITKDTIEEKIIELQNKKKELISNVINEGETFINKLTERELLELFSI